MAAAYATVDDLTQQWRSMTTEEQGRAQALLDIVSASLRVEACKVGKDLDAMVAESDDLAAVAKSVTVDVVARTLMTSTDQEPNVPDRRPLQHVRHVSGSGRRLIYQAKRACQTGTAAAEMRGDGNLWQLFRG